MLAEVSGVILVFALGVVALIGIGFLQRVLGAHRATVETSPERDARDPRRRTPLPFARVWLLWLLVAPALAFVVAWSAAVRDLGTPALTALAVFVAPLLVVGWAFVSKGGLDP